MIHIKYDALEDHDNLQKAWLDKHRCDICGNIKMKRHEVGVLNVCSECLKNRKMNMVKRGKITLEKCLKKYKRGFISVINDSQVIGFARMRKI